MDFTQGINNSEYKTRLNITKKQETTYSLMLQENLEREAYILSKQKL